MNDKVIAIPLETGGAPPAAAHEPMYVHLAISDPEVVLAASEYPEGRPRTDFMETALKVGVLALKAARGTLDSDTLRREGDSLSWTTRQAAEQLAQKFEERVTGTLSHYFDPQSGTCPIG